MQLIFIRHGKSLDDTNGLSQRDDSPLSELGAAQAKQRARDFANLTISACYVSTYQRAHETAHILFPSADIITCDDIYEIKRPKILTGGKHADAVRFWEVDHKKDKYNPDWSYDGSESFNDVTNRARQFIADMTARHGDSKHPVVIVSHGGFMRHCIGVVCKGDSYQPADFFELLLPMKVGNLDAVELTIEKGKKPTWYIIGA